jgi:hydroxymethylpyrimidine pyrophosphatase-like HAD family hydrolase
MSEIDNNLKMSSFFTCYGASVYDDNREKIISYSPLTSSEIKQIIDVLKEVSFNFSKIENRDDCIISLRFLDEDYRELLFKYAELKLTDLKVIKGGKKTIDIMKKDNDKMSNFKKHFNGNKDFFYVGDELDGNDEHMIKELNSLHVKNVLDTNTFLKYILLRN